MARTPIRNKRKPTAERGATPIINNTASSETGASQRGTPTITGNPFEGAGSSTAGAANSASAVPQSVPEDQSAVQPAGLDFDQPDDSGGSGLEQDGDEDILELPASQIVQIILDYREEAYMARRNRMRQNNINRDAFMGIQDWAHKTKGQSREFLPKTAVAVERWAAFIKKALIAFGDWFKVELSDEVRPYITDGQVRELLKYFFNQIPQTYTGNNKVTNLETIIGDVAKMGSLESLMILKVYSKDREIHDFYVQKSADIVDIETGSTIPGSEKLKRRKIFRKALCIDLVRTEDYYPDPTGRGLYEIHEVERDLIDIQDLAEAGIYDKEVVDRMKDEDFPKPEGPQDKRRAQQLGQDRSVPVAQRRRVLLMEFLGTLVDKEGNVVGRNVLATIANKKHLIRKPEHNPYWHQRSFFIAEPLIRVPFSVWHKALYDSASYLNFAINEMFNLMLDGGIADVWGIKQLRINHLVDPRQVEGGIPQATTLQVKDTLPDGQKVLEKVTEGSIPQDAMAIMDMLNNEFVQGALTNELGMGQLPGRPVKATEITTLEQNQSTTLASVVMDTEKNLIKRVIELSWVVILQFLDDIPMDDLVKVVGHRAAIFLSTMTAPERFARLANAAEFKVSGLTATLQATQDFQKLMAFLQAVNQNPIMMQAFLAKYSPDRIMAKMMQLLNINPDDLLQSPDEQKNLPQMLQQIMMFQQLIGGTQGSSGGQSSQVPQPPTGAAPAQGLTGPSGQGSAMTAGVNQQVQPFTGFKVQ